MLNLIEVKFFAGGAGGSGTWGDYADNFACKSENTMEQGFQYTNQYPSSCIDMNLLKYEKRPSKPQTCPVSPFSTRHTVGTRQARIL